MLVGCSSSPLTSLTIVTPVLEVACVHQASETHALYLGRWIQTPPTYIIATPTFRELCKLAPVFISYCIHFVLLNLCFLVYLFLAHNTLSPDLLAYTPIPSPGESLHVACLQIFKNTRSDILESRLLLTSQSSTRGREPHSSFFRKLGLCGSLHKHI
ncbi:hypothetical protein M758_UG204900 [Ceratodon purpureus]|nr:hypothetical protein M758_UG204900 [Ceratodon purpureus]